MNSFMNAYFGPLDKQWCGYFLILSFIFFISLVVIIIGGIYHIIMNRKKLDFKIISTGVIVLFNAWLSYFVNRLFYTMCNNSVH
jgi:hypothetical protein